MSLRALPEIVINGRFLMQPVTGVQRVARELVRALDHLVTDEARPVHLRLVCEPGADVSDLDLQVTTVERAGGASGHLWEQTVLPRRVHGGHLLCLGNTAPLAALYAAHPTTVMIHDLSYRQFPGAYRLHYRIGHRMMLPFLLRRAHTILTVSETEKAVLGNLRPTALRKIRVTPNGGWRDGQVQRRGPVPAESSGYVLYVGSLSRRKNIHGVLAVAVRLAREDGIATLLVGGTSDILSPIASAVPQDVRHLVRFIGPVTDLDELADLYRNAGCLLFPSLYEASPLPPIEAMSFGCPVVVSAIPSMTERCAAAALYCDPDDADGMARVVRRAIRDRAWIAERIERAYRHAARLTWHEQAERVIAALTGQPIVRQTRQLEKTLPVRERILADLH